MESELEMMFKIWVESEDYHYEVGPDSDGLGCIEIRYYEGIETTPKDRMMFDPANARLLHRALGRLLDELEKPQ